MTSFPGTKFDHLSRGPTGLIVYIKHIYIYVNMVNPVVIIIINIKIYVYVDK